MTESLYQIVFVFARYHDALHIRVPFDASVDVTEARKATDSDS
jgi:hypothetical protein